MNFEKYIKKIIEDYFWIIGLSLIVAGLIQSLYKEPISIVFSGLIFLIVAAIMKGFEFREKNNYFGTLYSENGKIIGNILRE